MLSSAPMHAITFAIKRTFQGSLRITRPWFLKFGLTPARFDMLYALEQTERGTTLQSHLRSILGVTAPTVSRMLASLEALGFIRRIRDPYDGRMKIVELTKRGFDAIRRAIRATIPQLAQLVVDSAFVRSWFSPTACRAQLAALEDTLSLARRQFRDHAKLDFL